MPANRFNGFTDYGVGIGLRVPHYRHILEKKPVVDWFEIISENYMVDAGRPLTVLDSILEQYRVVQHGVSMYFGSTDPLNRGHLKRLKALALRPSLLGLGRRPLRPRSASRALPLGGRAQRRRTHPPGTGLPRSARR